MTTGLDLDDFFARVRGAAERVLMLDYDGTLAPFHPRPERATPYPRVAGLLKDIVQMRSSRVVLVSGRRLADLRGPLTRIRHTEVWGAHGWQRCTARGERVDFRPHRAAERELQQAEVRARRLGLHGARLERKVASIAVHWRGLPSASAALVRERVNEAWPRASAQLEMRDFDGGVELRVRGRDKGDAVNEVLAECAAGAACAYLGDDQTDEDAFAAVKNRGLAVLVRPVLRPTRADLWLTPPEELVRFLERWHACDRR